MAIALQCDICGGTLEMNADGTAAVCINCGLQHSLDRMKTKVQEIKGTVQIEGDVHVSGVASVESLLQRTREFREAGDVQKLEEYYNRILDIDPENEEARAGLEDLVVEVGRIYMAKVEKLFPIGAMVILSNGREAFVHISRIFSVRARRIEDVLTVGNIIPVKVIKTGNRGIDVSMSDILRDISRGELSITDIPGLNETTINKLVEKEAALSAAASEKHLQLERAEKERQQQQEWRRSGRCQHCGGEFKGLFSKTCVKCGKPKDY